MGTMHKCPYCGASCECDAYDEDGDGEFADVCLHDCAEMDEELEFE